MKKNKNILVIHGPNLHMLGVREPKVYGTCTLAQINTALKKAAKTFNVSLRIMQSNSESDIINAITGTTYDALLINPAAYTHTSVAIRDAISAVNKPAVEVHISNIYTREDFRRQSRISDVVTGVISGFGVQSYLLGLQALVAGSTL